MHAEAASLCCFNDKPLGIKVLREYSDGLRIGPAPAVMQQLF